MTYFAKLDANNVVIFVTRGRQEDDGKEAELSARTGDTYKQTSYNSNIRKQFAGIGYTFDPDADVFIAPQPFPSWILDDNHDWQPPIPMPDGKHSWDENQQIWVKE